MLVNRVTGAIAIIAAASSPLAGQQPAADSALRGEVMGTVLDAESGIPLVGASVLLEPQPGGAVAPAAVGSAFWSSGLSATTDYAGEYRFSRIPPGTYRLLVRRLGYRPAVLAVELRQAAPLRVSVGLMVQPILLEPEEVSAPASLFVAPTNYVSDHATYRLDAELYRQRTFVESDVHVLTHTDVVEAVTLGETDLFRALHRLPGVTTRDDYTAELWTRGAPWSQTRVYFDGLPLFNPLHTGGVFSGINPDAVGAAFFHPGIRSVALGEGAAGVVDLTSRAGAGPEIDGAAEVSVVSGRLALDGGFGGSRGGWMVAGRRSYVDLLTSAFVDSANRVPYAFLDLTGRVDVPLGSAATLEVSGLWERDEVRGQVRDLLRENEGHWGNAVGRATLAVPVAGVYMRHTVGVSRYDAQLFRLGFRAQREALAATPNQLRDVAVTYQPTTNAIRHITLRSRFEPEQQSASPWSLGYDIAIQEQEYDGPVPRPYPVAFFPDTLRLVERRARGALWGAQRVSAGPVTLQAGLRLEIADDVANSGRFALAPRLSTRYAPTPRAALTAGASRTYQYTQAIAPAGPGVGPDLHLSEVWLMASDTVPAIRADLVTLGGETWLGSAWLGAVNVYVRRAVGVAIPDPVPGPVTSDRPVFMPATNVARGLEVSLRRLAGRVTGSIGYSHGSSRLTVDTLSFAAPTERRHALDLTGMLRLSPSLRVGAAMTAASGARFTRYLLETVPCDSVTTVCPDSVLLNTTVIGPPGAGRAPAYVSVDLLADWSHAFSSWSLGVFVQLRNAIDRQTAVTYVGSFDTCPAGETNAREAAPGVCDVFDRGLPLLPLVGVSVRF